MREQTFLVINDRKQFLTAGEQNKQEQEKHITSKTFLNILPSTKKKKERTWKLQTRTKTNEAKSSFLTLM